MDAGTAVRRGPGRPRNEEMDDLILTATLELIDADEDVTVARIVERSGVSRAALYRRWPSLNKLIAAGLDVGREVPRVDDADGDLRQSILSAFLMPELSTDGKYTERRLRQRLRLTINDPALLREYWLSHVTRRREPLRRLMRRGVDTGILRADTDIEAALDLIAGVVYYQFLVRGDELSDPATRARCQAALETVWRAIAA